MATTRKKAPKPAAEGAVTLLDAAAAALAKTRRPMTCGEMVEAVLAAGTWTTRGKTPTSTLSAAIHREIRDKGKEARFAKAERGQFRLAAGRRRQAR